MSLEFSPLIINAHVYTANNQCARVSLAEKRRAKFNQLPETPETPQEPPLTCVACTLPSLHLVSVVFGTAIPTSLYILYTCLYPILRSSIAFASFFQNPANKSVIITAIAIYTNQEWRYRGVGRGLSTITSEVGGLNPSKTS